MLQGFVVPLCDRAVKCPQGNTVSSIFSSWSQISTCTGRLSSSDPNLQNVPKADSIRFGNRQDMTKELNIRNAFVARNENVLLAADYVQCELRIMAHFCNDPSLIKLLSENNCPYTGIASHVLKKPFDSITTQERSTFKTVVCEFAFLCVLFVPLNWNTGSWLALRAWL